METALENLSKDDLLKVISSRDEKIDLLTSERDTLSQERDTLSQERDYLKAQVEMLKRMQLGQSRERFEGDPNQTTLPFEAEPADGIATKNRRLFYAAIFSFSNSISSICLGVLYPRAECVLLVL